MSRTVTSILCFVFLVSSCSSEGPKADSTTDTSVNAEMKGLRSVLTDLIVLVNDPKKFRKPENREKVLNMTNQLMGMSHNVSKKMVERSDDPTLHFVSTEFESDIRRTHDALRSGRTEYARQNLRSLTSYCIRCHTRGDNGPVFHQMAEVKGLRDLPSIQRGEYFAATRQFEKALEEFEQVIESDRKGPYMQLEWEKAIRYALTIAVREDPSPNKASQVIDKVLDTKDIPVYMKQDAKWWKKSIAGWKKESDSEPRSYQGQMRKAKELIAEIQKMQKYPGDHSADLISLRAQRLLHLALLNVDSANSPQKSWILFQLGTLNENSQDVDFWNLHEMYYESCIRFSPKTDIAHQCFNRLEQSVVTGYSGSSGYALPADEIGRLNRLRALAY